MVPVDHRLAANRLWPEVTGALRPGEHAHDRPDLVAHKQPLIDWVEQGGHLVVGYHKSFEWNAEGGVAPYPLTLGRDRVTDETATITVTAPDHPLFEAPHDVTAADWEGWVQERGLYFPAEADDRYRRLVTVGDPGEEALTTGLLLAEGDGPLLLHDLGALHGRLLGGF